MRQVRAFTLIEVVASLLLMSALIFALNLFVFGMGELWGQGADLRLFNRHVSAVAHHLQGMLLTSGGSPGEDGSSPAISVLPVRTEDGRQIDMLTWEVPRLDDVMVETDRPQSEVVCAVEVISGKGLLLHWHSRMDKDFETGPSHTTILTPFCTRLEYDFFDVQSGSWTTDLEMEKDQDGKWRLPMRIRLYFSHEKLKAERTIVVIASNAGGGLPPF